MADAHVLTGLVARTELAGQIEHTRDKSACEIPQRNVVRRNIGLKRDFAEASRNIVPCHHSDRAFPLHARRQETGPITTHSVA